jgi:multisubunit Na+/H+ antiporter MnhG subunit
MTAAYQDKRITILDEGITVGDKAFTMNLVNSAAITVTKPSGKPPWKKLRLSFVFTIIGLIGILLSDVAYGIFKLEWELVLALSIPFALLLFLGAPVTLFLLARCLWLNKSRPSAYNLVLNITGNDQIVLSSTDKDYIHMLAGLINTFKGYTPEPDPSFDYEGEVLE